MKRRIIKKEDKRSYLILVETANKRIVVPVIDVRDGEKERTRAKSILKNRNASKFMKPSFSADGKSYNVSPKTF